MPRRSQKSIPSWQTSSAARGALVLPAGEREIVVLHGGGEALALIERELERPPQVIKPLALAQVGASDASRAERPSRLGQVELGGERERPLGRGNRIRVGTREVADPR